MTASPRPVAAPAGAAAAPVSAVVCDDLVYRFGTHVAVDH